MAQAEKERHHSFFTINVKLRKLNSKKEVSVTDYANLFIRLFNSRVHAQSSPGKHCILKTQYQHKVDGKLEYLYGTLAQFTFIENKNWFNLEKMDLDKQFRVPDGLFPDPMEAEYVFIPSSHRFAFRISSKIRLSPYPVAQFLNIALDKVSKKNELVQVNVVTSSDALEIIRNAIEIKKLVIDVNYSNHDTGSSTKKLFEDEIKNSNIIRVQIVADQKPGKTIELNKTPFIDGALEAAESDGDAEATIIDSNKDRRKIKTSDYPRKDKVFGYLTNFTRLAAELIEKKWRPNGNKPNNRKSE